MSWRYLVYFYGLALPAGSVWAQQASEPHRQVSGSDSKQQQTGTAEQDRVAPEIGILYTAITVTASRTSEPVDTVPQAIGILTDETIGRTQARTPNQMLREEPGIWSVQVSNQGSPIIRGQIGNRVLYLWNGVRLNNGALFSGPNGYFNQVPTGSVERMEVIQGPGAVQYGSDAIGGVINVLTRNPRSFASRFQAGGDFEVRYGTVDLEKTGTATGWIAGDRFTAIASYTGQHIGDYTAPTVGRLMNTGFEAEGGNAGLTFRVRQNQTLRLSLVHDLRWDVGTYSQSKMNPSGIPRVFGPMEQRGVAKGDYEFQNLGAWSRDLALYTYYEYYDQLRDQTNETASVLNRTRTDTAQRMWGGGAQNTTNIRKIRVVYGTDYRTDTLASDKGLFTTAKLTGAIAFSVPNGNVPPGNYDVYDAFAIVQADLLPRLSVSAGARFESDKLISYPRPQDALTPFTVDDLRLSKRWDAGTWSAGAVYHAGAGFSLRGNVATGFRAPTFSDTLSTGVPVYASGIASVPSTGIAPERSITYELGPRFATRRFTANLTAYSTQLSDLLASTNVGKIAIPGIGTVIARANMNVASGYVRGVEASWAYQPISSFTAFGNFTVTRGQDTFRNVPLRFIPPAFGTVGARWANPRQFWWIEATTMVADRLRRHAPDDEFDAGFSRDPGYGSPSATNPPYRPNYQIPGFAVANLRVGVDLFKDSKRGAQVFVNLSNLFDLRYREAYSQQQLLAPGRGALVGLRFRL